MDSSPPASRDKRFNEVREYASVMDKKEINSPKLTEHFLFWVCGLGGLLLVVLLAHFVYHLF